MVAMQSWAEKPSTTWLLSNNWIISYQAGGMAFSKLDNDREEVSLIRLKESIASELMLEFFAEGRAGALGRLPSVAHGRRVSTPHVHFVWPRMYAVSCGAPTVVVLFSSRWTCEQR